MSKNRLFKNILILFAGAGSAKIIVFAATPVLTRIYSPGQFGVLSLFVAVSMLVIPVATMRFPNALPLPKNENVAVNMAALSIIILFSVVFFLGILFFLCGKIILDALSLSSLNDFIWLLLITVIAAGMYEILTGFCNRSRRFKVYAQTQIWQAILSSLIKIGLGVLGFLNAGLLIGHFFSQAGGVFTLYRAFRSDIKKNIKRVSFVRIKYVFRRYIDFPLYRLPSQFLLVFSVQAPVLFSGIIFNESVTGQLGLALSTLSIPMSLLGTTTGQAFYGEIAKLGKGQPVMIRKIAKDVAIKMFLISIPPFVALFFFGPLLFSWVFGDSWNQAGVFASILSIYLLAQFISAPLVNVFNVFEKQALFLRINIVRVLLILFVFGVSYVYSLSSEQMIFLYSYILTAHYLYVSYLCFKVIK
ncbi:lipopolysaccharide biosynthesis protein [Halotalea alkalilenta]|uniref:lipopolysaccharide biosynthesis protein n=1 Tax=Halotalea alkalilenta TaxID=376489 RepID=UPI0009ED022C|nr:oligosaccharide flippase family protein [Halotalea alkalilenta]